MIKQQLCSQLIIPETKNQFIIDKFSSNVMDAKLDKMLIQALEYVDDGDYSNALKLYDLVLREEPDNTHALIDKGVTLQNMGRLKSAIRCYDKVLTHSPKHVDALLNKGASLHSDQKYLEAIECYDIALKVDKKCTMALAYKGLSLGEMGKLQDAIKYFKKALSIDEHYDLANISKDIAQDLLKSIKTKKI